MFGPRMHPGCFKSVLLLEDGVGDDKLLLSAKLQQQAPIVIVVANATSAKYYFPGICILAHSSIEITKDYNLVICRGALETAAEFWVELVFSCGFSSKSYSIHTKKHGIPLIFQSKAQGHHVVGMISWQIFPAWRQWRCWPWNQWLKGAPLFKVSLPRRGCISGAILLEAAFSWEADLTKGSNVNI